jgi:hypothetical protein
MKKESEVSFYLFVTFRAYIVFNNEKSADKVTTFSCASFPYFSFCCTWHSIYTLIGPTGAAPVQYNLYRNMADAQHYEVEESH